MARDDARPEIEIEQTTRHEEALTGPYGDRGCDEALHVVIDDEDVYVPFTNVRKAGYDFHGPGPETLDVDRIILYDGQIHAEADVEDGVIELVPDYNEATSEFRGYDSWKLHYFGGDTDQMGEVVAEREEVA